MSWIDEERHRESKEVVPGFEDLKPQKYKSVSGDDVHFHKENKDIISSGLDKNKILFFIILMVCITMPPFGIIMLLTYVKNINNRR